jgi:peptidoglycan/LPS O-acetylase OafA/YrhL
VGLAVVEQSDCLCDDLESCWIPIHGGLFVSACCAAFLCRATLAYPYLLRGCEVLFVFWFACNRGWRGFNRFGDYSYGIYPWGFPSQQMVAALAPNLPFLLNSLCGFAIALLLAILSWKFIEKPALRLKAAPGAFMRNFRKEPAPA